MATVTIRYWAGARAAAGTEQEAFQADTLEAALQQAGEAHPGELGRVLSICSFLVDGRRADDVALTRPLHDDVLLEALPPFAGG